MYSRKPLKPYLPVSVESNILPVQTPPNSPAESPAAEEDKSAPVYSDEKLEWLNQLIRYVSSDYQFKYESAECMLRCVVGDEKDNAVFARKICEAFVKENISAYYRNDGNKWCVDIYLQDIPATIDRQTRIFLAVELAKIPLVEDEEYVIQELKVGRNFGVR